MTSKSGHHILPSLPNHLIPNLANPPVYSLIFDCLFIVILSPPTRMQDYWRQEGSSSTITRTVVLEDILTHIFNK